MPDEHDVTAEEQAAFEKAYEELQKVATGKNISPGTPEWEAEVNLAIAQYPILAKQEAFRDYLEKQLPRHPDVCQRTKEVPVENCKEGPTGQNYCTFCKKRGKL